MPHVHTPLMTLSDDGTMDTVIMCSLCGEEFRYTYLGSPDTATEDWDSAYNDFVKWAIQDAAERHLSSHVPTCPHCSGKLPC